MRKLPWVVGLVLLAGCRVLSDAFTAHAEVVVRVDDEELTVERLAQLLVLGQQLPLRLGIAEELARHWVDVTALLDERLWGIRYWTGHRARNDVAREATIPSLAVPRATVRRSGGAESRGGR